MLVVPSMIYEPRNILSIVILLRGGKNSAVSEQRPVTVDEGTRSPPWIGDLGTLLVLSEQHTDGVLKINVGFGCLLVPSWGLYYKPLLATLDLSSIECCSRQQ